MSKILLHYVLPLLVPTAAYVAWIWYERKKHLGEGDPPGLRKGSLFWCLLAGFVLMLGGLATLALVAGDPPDSGEYISPRLEGGKIVPPRFKKDGE